MPTREVSKPRILNHIHRPVPAQYSVREDGTNLIVSCQYWESCHSRTAGGNISSVIFPHGSGKNIFAAPFATQLQKGLPWAEPFFDNSRDTQPELIHRQVGDNILVESRSRLLDDKGNVFPAACLHTFTYTPWGLVRQKVTLDFAEPIPDLWKMAIARPVVALHLNEFTYRPPLEAANEWTLGCKTQPWDKLGNGEGVRDALAVQLGDIPLYMIFLQRGVEGFDWCCGENLDQWRKQFSARPHVGKFSVGHNATLGGNEVCLYPLDMWNGSIAIQGRHEFDFFLGLPFVQERVRPMFRVGGVLNELGSRRKAAPRNVFMNHENIAELGAHHAQVVRLHDDSPQPEGIFWRDGSYPPYPPEIMKTMDASLADLHAHGIGCTPYFSMHEINPETPGYEHVAQDGKRTIGDDGQIIHNYASNLGIWGSQMCLLSNWSQVLKQSIDTILKHHAFDGLYFDWTEALPCRNPAHRNYAHWDIEGFVDLLAWARNRVGENGLLYLHMSLEPFIMAENLANCVLVYESPGPSKPTSDMFPPVAEFMKTCSHIVLDRHYLKKYPRPFMLHALLNHVTTSGPSEDFLAAYDVLAKIDFTQYRQFANSSISPATTTAKDVLSAVYWNEKEALVLLANLSEAQTAFRWKLDTTGIGWGNDKFRVVGKRPGELAPLAFQYVRIVRKAAPSVGAG